MYQCKILLALALFAKFILAHKINYCSLGYRHVLCTYTSKGEACGDDFKEIIPTSSEQLEILDFHNKMRQKVALGSKDVKTLPPAANMMKMEWDDELAKMAQITADQCLFQHDCENGTCRDVAGQRFGVGQNIGIQNSTIPSCVNFTIVLQKWYKDEASYLAKSSSVIDLYQNTNKLWGNFSQIIWWNSRSVGCGGSYFTVPGSDVPYHFLVICNYGVAGNIDGNMIYTRGPGCSKCPEGTKCDTEYPGLCAIADKAFEVKRTFRTDKLYEIYKIDDGSKKTMNLPSET